MFIIIISLRRSERIAIDPPTAISPKELTMNTVLGGRIVAGWASNAASMRMFRVHQIEYPEIEAEGKSPAEACMRLIGLLVQAIDYASDAWRRQPLGLALADARAFDRSYSECVDRAYAFASSLVLTRLGPPTHCREK